MLRFARVGMLLLLAVAAPSYAYDDLQLRLLPRGSDFFLEGLDRDSRLARIDALETGLKDLGPLEREQRELEIGLLYATSDLVKHRVWAIERLEKGWDGQGPSLTAMLYRGLAMHLSDSPWNAIRAYADAAKAFPDSAAAHRELGRAQLDLALMRLDDRRLVKAEAAFRRAVACPDAGDQDWIGLASTLLARGKHRELLEWGELLLASSSPSLGAKLYAAIGYEASGLRTEATRIFHEVFQQLDDEALVWFQKGETLFSGYDPLFLDETSSDIGASASTVVWWVRVLEVECIFGDRLHDQYGWNSSPGRLWLRYGRPDRTVYFQPSSKLNTQSDKAGGAPSLDEMGALYGLDSVRNSVGVEISNWEPSSAYWLWIYEFGKVKMPFFFRAYTVLADWKATQATQNRTEALVEQLPVRLTPLQAHPDLALFVRHSAFRTLGADVRAEAYFAIRRIGTAQAADESDSFKTTITVLDREGQRIDRIQTHLSSDHRRERILAGMGWPASDDPTVVGRLAVDLPPQVYTLRLEVEDLHTGAYRAHDRRFELKPQDRLFDLSDIQLCDAFADYDDAMNLPAAFVKHARVVVPHPESTISSPQDEIYLYYEVYGAATDQRSEAHLGVIYEIFEADGFSSFDAGLPAGQAAQAPRIRIAFEDERTGRSPAGIVVKGTRLDLTELEEGRYVIAVSVSDELARDETRRFLRFRR